jgi:hypothetical protein
VLVEGPEVMIRPVSSSGGGWFSMNSTTIITGLTPLQAMELVCLVYGADYLHVPGTTHRRSRGYGHPPMSSGGAAHPSHDSLRVQLSCEP